MGIMRCKKCFIVAFILTVAVNSVGSLHSICDISILGEEASANFIVGETFLLSCKVRCTNVSKVDIFWDIPGNDKSGHINIESNNQREGNSIFKYTNITIYNASKEDEGKYICMYNTSDGQKYNATTFNKILVEPFLIIEQKPKSNSLVPDKMVQLINTEIIAYEAYPPVTNWSLLKNGEEISLLNNHKKYEVNIFSSYVRVRIRNLSLEDTANYTLVLRSKLCEDSYTYEVRPVAHPEIKLIPGTVVKAMRNSKISLKCVVTGYPLPPVKWHYPKRSIINVIEKKETNPLLYNKTLLLEATILDSGNITCFADDVKATVSAFVYEVPGGFYIKNNSRNWYPENYNVTKECVASKYDFDKLIWTSGDNKDLDNSSQHSETYLSHVSKLNIKFIKLNESGEYICIGYRKDKRLDIRKILITVAKTELPHIEGKSYQDVTVSQYERAVLSCCVHAVPPPLIEWRKDGDILIETNTVTIITKTINETTVNSTIIIKQVQHNETGKYECHATSGKVQVEKVYNLSLKGNVTARIIAAVAVTVIIILITVVLYLYKKKKYYEKLFEEGCMKKLDPKLPINRQANLLPYNKKYEISKDKIILEQVLGSGEFGEVFKATAFIEPRKATTVAVKKVKKYADKTAVEALVSELKILQHIGKHSNIVNLLGACTKNYIKGELLVIVEYCEFGNLRNHLINHRAIFVDHFLDHIHNQAGQVNKGFSNDNDVASRMESSDCNCSPKRSYNIESNQKSEPKVTASNYITQSALKKKNNISSTVSLCSQDLVHWAYQIALGMEHLGNRKVLHGDLATRNILLAQGNVVKICDFGLSTKLYEKAYCSKNADSPLPIKWLAIECLTDLIFSTQSDIWAFGVVLWELFSLGMTPYPNKDPSSLVDYLLEGKRMPAPPYADDRLYKIMQQCWYKAPNKRPSFTQLREKLYFFLNENIRQQCTEMGPLQISYKTEGDYVSMMCQPDFDNMSSFNPHTYVVASPLTTKEGMWEMKSLKK